MTSVFQSQHDHYADVRRRLMSGSTPPERPRHWVEPKEQPHRPDLPQPALPYIREAAPAITPRGKRIRDIILVATPDFLVEAPTKQIIRECCVKYHVTKQELIGPKRDTTIVQARQEAAFRMSKETRLSLSQIGRKLGRDHTTILHAIRRYEARLAGTDYKKSRNG